MARLGQHFLTNSSVLSSIADALRSKPGEIIIEIGPGHGELTKFLLQGGGSVIAIEKDPHLAEYLRKTLQNPSFVLSEGDVRDTLPRVVADIGGRSYKIAGNIPYYLTGQILRDISELPNLPERAVFTIQKEVAERIVAAPPRMNRLAASVSYWAQPRIVRVIGRHDFSPAPKVDSATILLERKGAFPCPRAAFEKALGVIFSQPRKTVLNNLKSAGIPAKDALLALTSLSLPATSRPQNISIDSLCSLARTLFP